MSVGAYRQITTPEVAEEATFNLSDITVLEKLERLPSTKIMGGEFEIDYVELFMPELEDMLKHEVFEPELMEAFRRDIQAAKEKGEGYIFYTCY